MLKLLFMIFAGLLIGALLLILLLPFFLFLFFLKLFSKKGSGRAFVWKSGPQGENFYNAGDFNRKEKRNSENFSDSVYDIKAEVVETVKKTEDSKQIQE